MRSFSSSARAVRLNPKSARFEAEYTLYSGIVMNAVPELMFTMLPPPWSRITGITACIATIGANTLRWKISSNKEGSISSIAAA